MAHDATPTLRDASPATQAVEDAEVVAAGLRLRRVLGGGTLLWLISVASDPVTAMNVAPRELAHLLELRAFGTIAIGAAWLWMRARPRPSRRALRLVAVLTFTTLSATISLMGALAGGLASPYYGGVLLVAFAYGVTVNDQWRRGVIDAAGTLLAYPTTTLVAAAIQPSLRAQFSVPLARATFSGNMGNLICAYLVVVVTGHVVWALRRQVFEARSLGRYKLKRRLGAGGMGEVWLAHHSGLKRDVALKILRVDHARDPQAIARFEREVRATTELVHPNTVRVFDYGVSEDGIWYYAMELLEGENLGALVAREGALAVARAVHLIAQVARALAEAHAKGIVHRDVKPENLFVVALAGERDFVKVLDFGIAKVRAADESAKLTLTGSVVGTPLWLAPETIRGEAIDARADVYALGAVLYFLLAGRPPFEAATNLALMQAHLVQPPARPSMVRGNAVPSDVERVTLRCLEKDPASRFPTARELAEALEECDDARAWTREDAEAVRIARAKTTTAPSPFAPTAIDPVAPTATPIVRPPR